MPTLEDFFRASEQYSMEDMDLIPEDLRNEINAQLELSAPPVEEEPAS